MDKNIIVVYYFTMKLRCPFTIKSYHDPDVRILIMMRRMIDSWHYDNINPPYWRFYWNSAPGAMIHYKGDTIKLTPKMFVMIPPNTIVAQRMVGPPISHFYAHFIAKAPFSRLHSKIYTFEAKPELLASIQALPVNVSDFLTADLNTTMAVLGVIHCLLAKIPAAELAQVMVSSEFEKSLTFIESHIGEALSNQQIAQHMGTSVNTMLRKYQRELGMSPQTYLRRKRMELACALLHERQLSIEQIAEATGFCDRYYFTKSFKKFTGATPARLHGVGRERRLRGGRDEPPRRRQGQFGYTG